MKSTIRELISVLDSKFIEFITFIAFILFGVFVKMIREKKTPTIKRILSEIAMSFFVALIVYAVLVQFFALENYFVYASCSYAGSISSKFLDNMEKLIDSVFIYAQEKLKQWKSKKK